MHTLSSELFWLTCTIILTACMWIPYVANRILELGPWTALQNPTVGNKVKAAWAQRTASAHTNAVENLVLFAPLVLAIEHLGINSEQTAMLCAVFFFTRAAHFVIYWIGIPLLRTLSFLLGFAVIIKLALTVLA